MLQLLLWFFGVLFGIAVVGALFRMVKSYIIISGLCDRLTKDLLQRMDVAKVSADQFDYIEVRGSALYIHAPYEVGRALSLSSGWLDFTRKNGGKIYLSEELSQKKMVARRLISGLGLTNYTYVKKQYVYSSENSYTSTIKDSDSGVKVTTQPTISSGNNILICRKDRVREFAPKKVRDYHL